MATSDIARIDESLLQTVTGTRIAPTIDYRVRLVRAASVGSNNVESVFWDATPDFSESRNVMYKNIDPTHAPGAIYQYANTGSRTFNIQGKFISRSRNEATKTLAYIQYLRTWAMPVFGNAGTALGEDILGAPPAILFLTAYAKGQPLGGTDRTVPSGTSASSAAVPAIGNNIWQVPVVITSLEIPYPSDVDYIPTINNIPVPTIMNVSVTLTETHSPNAYLNFNIQAFKEGNLINF